MDRDMRHSRLRRRTVPVALSWIKPDDVSRQNVVNRTAICLDTAFPGDDEKCLSERVGMPGSTRAWLESNGNDPHTRRVGSRDYRIHANVAGKMFTWPLA